MNKYFTITEGFGPYSYILGMDENMKKGLQKIINKYPGNDITPKQLNEIIKEYGPDGFTKDEVEKIWNDNYKG